MNVGFHYRSSYINDFETVTIYYRWHPLFGKSLPVRKRRRDGDCEHIYCDVDGKIYPIPSWMVSPECSQFSLGPSLVSVRALFKLRDLLAGLPLPADCDRASLQATAAQEGIDEAIGKATLPADEPSAEQCAANRKSSGPE